GPLDVWHAEDMALVFAAYHRREVLKEANPNAQVPPPQNFQWKAQIVAYGKYNNNDPVGFKPACGEGNIDNARMQPPCASVLGALQIDYITE
ncbi:MAG: hypothetical protein Q9169_007288, partial [Polycauliona sp. 2 TL-2023]